MKKLKKSLKSGYPKFQFESLEKRLMGSVTPNSPAAAMSVALPDVASTPAIVAPNVATAATAGASPNPSLLSPSQMRHIYGLDNQLDTGSGQTIALIEAYNDPAIQTNVNVFNKQYSLPALQVNIVTQPNAYTIGYKPPYDATWAKETAMDIEWAHAAAPYATIKVFEANTGNFSDEMTMVSIARNDPSVSVISMSFGVDELVDEHVTYDSLFTTPSNHTPITFIASSGDTGESPQYPATSPNVLSVGGTTLKLSNGNFSSETVWNDNYGSSNGGASHYESKPSYQSSITLSNNRMVPDVTFASDLAANAGTTNYGSVNTYDTPDGGWTNGGGTSLGAPVWAGIIADANQGRAAFGHTTLGNAVADMYYLNHSDFHDVSSGSNKDGIKATQGYDMASGLGSPAAQYLIPDLAAVVDRYIPIIPTVPVGGAIGAGSTSSSTTGNASASTPLIGTPSDPVAVDKVFGGDLTTIVNRHVPNILPQSIGTALGVVSTSNSTKGHASVSNVSNVLPNDLLAVDHFFGRL